MASLIGGPYGGTAPRGVRLDAGLAFFGDLLFFAGIVLSFLDVHKFCKPFLKAPCSSQFLAIGELSRFDVASTMGARAGAAGYIAIAAAA
jgi:hypothetical protein